LARRHNAEIDRGVFEIALDVLDEGFDRITYEE